MIIEKNGKLPEEFENLEAADFERVQENTEIHDEEFKTKPIGFYKDALRRLAKNKLLLYHRPHHPFRPHRALSHRL